jgi:Protein of unknown function (DUF3455)
VLIQPTFDFCFENPNLEFFNQQRFPFGTRLLDYRCEDYTDYMKAGALLVFLFCTFNASLTGAVPFWNAPARILAVQKPTVPDSIRPPAGEELVLKARATGFQVYICRPGPDGKPAWTLKAPEAQLFDEQGKVIGKHFGGPSWQLNDGSQVTGKMAAKVDAPDPKAIPWLLVTVTGHSGNGALGRVTSIQRVNTVAGLPPAASDCTQQSGEAEFKSKYSADYYFYANK